MATFIDGLAYSLCVISFAGFMLLYIAAATYLSYRKNNRDFKERLSDSWVLLLVLGIYISVSAIWGQFSWPLPGSYNILFYDPMVSFGLILVIFSLSVRLKLRLDYTGFLGLMMGVMTIIYGLT